MIENTCWTGVVNLIAHLMLTFTAEGTKMHPSTVLSLPASFHIDTQLWTPDKAANFKKIWISLKIIFISINRTNPLICWCHYSVLHVNKALPEHDNFLSSFEEELD